MRVGDAFGRNVGPVLAPLQTAEAAGELGQESSGAGEQLVGLQVVHASDATYSGGNVQVPHRRGSGLVTKEY